MNLNPSQDPSANHDTLEVDDIEFLKVVKGTSKQVGKWKLIHKPKRWPCKGILVTFPEGTDHHLSYPFGIHNKHSIPWNYMSIDEKFYLQAKVCQKSLSQEGGTCKNCQNLTSSTLYTGIMSRIRFGAHENIPLVYHGVRGLMTVTRRKTDQNEQLRMSKLNNSRKLLVKASTLEDHKQWILAIASGQVERVALLVQAGLKHQAGIRTLIQQYERAAEKLYKPKGYTNKDIMRSIVLLQLGCAHVAEFAHQSLALPSLTTIRCQTIMPTLLISSSAPTIAEVESNIISCYSSLGSCRKRLVGTSHNLKIIHQVIMLDELAVKKRIRWDNLHNKFQGTYREHNHRIPLDFTLEKELDILCEAIENNEVHLATEVRV